MEDYAAAIDAARVPLVLQDGQAGALTAAQDAIDRTLRALQRPEPVSLLAVVNDLRAIGKRGRPVLKRLLPELPTALAAADARAGVIDLLKRSDVTAIVALVDAASADVGNGLGTAAIANALIATFAALTSREVVYSRFYPLSDDKGRPTGPLIRYLTEIYRRPHTRLEADGFTRHLAHERLWSPRPETLVTWIETYRLRAA